MARRAYSWAEFLDGLRHGEGTSLVVLALMLCGIAMAVLIWKSTNRKIADDRDA
ncbi:hypothetical protein P12x_002134 [Tundrisphaera lichenicola]|uniref:hypothetical protein n=1 Tax=Tundrisphaera lichenicola TaxID=2029860 RepID=UPI003EBA3CF2